jgi:hypothetical protein
MSTRSDARWQFVPPGGSKLATVFLHCDLSSQKFRTVPSYNDPGTEISNGCDGYGRHIFMGLVR